MGLVPIGFLPEDQPEPFYASFSFSQAISSDGQVVVGSSSSTKHLDRGDQAFRWTMGEGMVALGFLPGENQSSATAVSADGSVVVGMSGMTAFRWSEDFGMESLGFFSPTGVSEDGTLVVGTTQSYPSEAVVWTEATGVQPLQTYLQDELNISLPAWQGLTEAIGISDDGSVVAGTGINAAGFTEAFIATLNSTVETSGGVTYGGAVNVLLVDPEGKRSGTSPETGESLAEIPGLTLKTEDGLKTAAWPEILSGEHLVYVQGSADGNYQLEFDFLHLDSEDSGASFAGELLKGGLHVYAAEISAGSAGDSQFQLIYSDTDGDSVVDSADAVPKSDMREMVFVGRIQTAIPNRVFSNGTTLNDIIKAKLAGTVTLGKKVSILTQLTNKWITCGYIPKGKRASLIEAAKRGCR
jgi:probable HAF family extracellular repeat protein